MNYSDVVKLARNNGICIQPHIIPLGLIWNSPNLHFSEVYEDIDWQAVAAQTSMDLSEDDLEELDSMDHSEWFEFLANELGFQGVLIYVASTKLAGSPNTYRCSDAYAYLADPDWEQVVAEIDKLVDRVMASWREDKP